MVTIGDVLKNAGYACGNVSVWHLGEDEKPVHGFTDFWRTYRYLDKSLPDPFFRYLDSLAIANPYAKGAEGLFSFGSGHNCGTLTDPRVQRTTRFSPTSCSPSSDRPA